MFSQSVPVQLGNVNSKLVDPNSIENITMAIPTTSSNVHPIAPMMTNNDPLNITPVSSTTTSTPTTSAQNHVPPSTANHITKPMSSVSNQSAVVNTNQILTKSRLQDLVKEIDPCEQLDEEVEELLLQLVDDFVNSTVNTACIFAKHRNAASVEVKDVQLYLEKTFQMWLPGFGTEEVKPYKKPLVTEAHKQRLALIRKSLKKY